MNWIVGIQKAIDYIEDNITEDLNYDKIAKIAYSSSFHFQKVFFAVCGMSIAEYVRRRRLTMAVDDILKNKKVIDVALNYGYETPESFTRAFKSFHGATPTQIKNGTPAKFFSRLSVKLILEGGKEMDYRIVKLDSFKIVCKRKKVKAQKEFTFDEIPKFWQQCGEDGSIEKLVSYIPQNPKLKGLLGISFSQEFMDDAFPYGIGVEYSGSAVSGEFEIIEIPSYTYAVFPVKGEMPSVFKETYKRILTEFFPQSGYAYAKGVEIEVYPSDNVSNPNYYCEIWVAIK